VAQNELDGDYHTEYFFKMHEYIFQDLFEWAGQPRNISIYKEEDVIGGQSIEYSDPFDIVNDVHHVLSDIAMASGYCSVRLAAYVSNGFKSRMLHKRNGIKTVVTVSHGII
jgi:fido (protein-threonine AMPylation protein)